MTFEDKLKNYAELLVKHGLNVCPGQIVNIGAEVVHREFAYLLAEAAYGAGAKYVNLDLVEPRMERLRLTKSKEEDLKYVPNFVVSKYDELLDSTAANIRILGSEDPDLISDLDPKKINTTRLAFRGAVKRFYEEGIGKSKVQWTLGAAATEKWGQKVFPNETPEVACQKLWDAIFSACRADKENCLELWQEHNAVLHRRAKRLTELKIESLHFTGNGTDLRVFLSKRAIFKGGSDTSPRGVDFEPNIPTEEVFTTPDCRKTQGRAVVTRPFLVNGKLIRDLVVDFKDGEIVNFEATSGKETFAEYISSDSGSKKLGEVALVGIDSPVFQTGLIFEEILFDENAACHIAIGSAYKFCIEGGATLESKEALEIGCNESSVHTDMMISSEKVDVSAKLYDGRDIKIIEKGKWLDGF